MTGETVNTFRQYALFKKDSLATTYTTNRQIGRLDGSKFLGNQRKAGRFWTHLKVVSKVVSEKVPAQTPGQAYTWSGVILLSTALMSRMAYGSCGIGRLRAPHIMRFILRCVVLYTYPVVVLAARPCENHGVSTSVLYCA